MNSADARQFCEEAFCRGLAPEPQLLVSDSAARYRILAATSAMPGPWNNDITPYLVEPMDCWSVTSPIEKIVLMKSAQVGGSEMENNCLLHTIINAPGVVLVVSITDAASRRTVRLRIDPMIDACPVLSKLVTRRRSRSSANTDEMKKFPGGMAFFVGSNSPSAIRSTPCRYVLLDEVDGYPPGTGAGGEGDIVALTIARTPTFCGKRKIAMVSTPTLKDVSRIEKAFLEGDQRRYHVPCPFCGTLQHMKFSQLRWPGQDRTKTFYVCEACGESVNEKHKSAMVAAGVWIPSAEGDGKRLSISTPWFRRLSHGARLPSNT